jgi:hypothetical protein
MPHQSLSNKKRPSNLHKLNNRRVLSRNKKASKEPVMMDSDVADTVVAEGVVVVTVGEEATRIKMLKTLTLASKTKHKINSSNHRTKTMVVAVVATTVAVDAVVTGHTVAVGVGAVGEAHNRVPNNKAPSKLLDPNNAARYATTQLLQFFSLWV